MDHFQKKNALLHAVSGWRNFLIRNNLKLATSRHFNHLFPRLSHGDAAPALTVIFKVPGTNCSDVYFISMQICSFEQLGLYVDLYFESKRLPRIKENQQVPANFAQINFRMITRRRYLWATRKFTTRDDGTGPRARRDPASSASLGIIYDFYYAVKMREFLQGTPRSHVDPRVDRRVVSTTTPLINSQPESRLAKALSPTENCKIFRYLCKISRVSSEKKASISQWHFG